MAKQKLETVKSRRTKYHTAEEKCGQTFARRGLPRARAKHVDEVWQRQFAALVDDYGDVIDSDKFIAEFDALWNQRLAEMKAAADADQSPPVPPPSQPTEDDTEE